MFDTLESDIVVMQELKIQRKDLRDDMVLVDGWDCYFSLPKHKKGYSGVGVYTRNATCAPIRAEEGLLGVLPSPSGTPYRDLPDDESIGGYPSALQVADLGVDAAVLDAEGRCVVVEFPAFVLFGVYSPANSNGLRDDFRYGFICALDCRIRNLVKQGKNVVLVGDLNVTRQEMDSAPTLEDIRKMLGTREEYLMSPNRRIFNQLLIGGEVLGERDEGREQGVLYDTTREFHPDRAGMYTHWETKVNARPGNYGSRIDFVLVSTAMRSWIKDANIQEGLLGSDHCPVYVDFNDVITWQDGEIPLLDMMSPPGTFVESERKQEWKIASTPAFSAKRMPEFDKRRSIKSMFAAPVLKKSQSSQQSTKDAPDDPISTTNVESSKDVNGSGQIRPAAAESKRKASMTQESPLKKQKSETKTTTSKGQGASKGQQSLRGFFQAKSQPATIAVDKDPATGEDAGGEADVSRMIGEVGRQWNSTATPTSTQQTEIGSPTPSPSKFASQLASAEQTQRSWGALFSKPAAPLCESHQEPCKPMQTKKKGSNQGRSFWMCARPLGPSGDKERGTQWRCPTFIWCSDWQPKKEGGTSKSPVKGSV